MRGIFLDRDGVIIRKAPEGEYISDWSEVEFLPGALEAMAAFCSYGLKIIIVTNQRGVASGKINIPSLQEIHWRIDQAARLRGAHITDIYYCPHEIRANCPCRKPKPGMLLRAAEAHGLFLTDCWMIGDSPSDIAAGRSAGCRTALVARTLDSLCWSVRPDLWANSLASLCERILRKETSPEDRDV